KKHSQYGMHERAFNACTGVCVGILNWKQLMASADGAIERVNIYGQNIKRCFTPRYRFLKLNISASVTETNMDNFLVRLTSVACFHV
ncbi:hypothetical protein ACJX0J_041012, partial [Zea mays]